MHLASVDFSCLLSSRAATPASESDGRAHAKPFPAPLGTLHTQGQYLHETRRSLAISTSFRRRMRPRLSVPPPAPRFRAHGPAPPLQKQSLYGEAALARQKKIFALPAPVPWNLQARADSAAAASTESFVDHVQSAPYANSWAHRSPPRRLPQRARGALASCPESQSRKRPQPPSIPRA